MPINANGSLYSQRFHPTDGERGFYPYTVVVKKNGVYIEGETALFLHISLHHKPTQKNPLVSQCHLTIPKEMDSRIHKHGFDSRQYFKWERLRGLDNRPHRACLLIFPALYAEEKFATTVETEIPLTTIPISGKASIIEFWFSGLSENKLKGYLEGFSNPLLIKTLPNQETLGITHIEDKSRDYSVFQKTEDYGRYSLVKENEVKNRNGISVHVGPYGLNCFGVLHGNPNEINNVG